MIDKNTYVKLLKLANELMGQAITESDKPNDQFMARVVYMAQVELLEKALNYDKIVKKL